MAKPIKAALAGAGAFGLKHLDAMKLIDGVEVISLVGRELDKTKEAAAKYGVAHATTDLAETLQVPGLDAVILATPTQMQRLYTHLEQVLGEVDFNDRTLSGTHLMSRIRRFLQRAELDQNEVNILRGILTAVQNKRRTAGSAHAPKESPQ